MDSNCAVENVVHAGFDFTHCLEKMRAKTQKTPESLRDGALLLSRGHEGLLAT